MSPDIAGPRALRRIASATAALSSFTTDDATTVLTVRGELDVFTAPRLREQLLELSLDGEGDVVLDMSGLTFVDSTGLGVMVGGLKRLRETRRELILRSVPASSLRVLTINGLTNVLTIIP